MPRDSRNLVDVEGFEPPTPPEGDIKLKGLNDKFRHVQHKD